MSDTQAATLGAEDYGALLGMLTSSDASARTQGQSLAKKLTPDEQQSFFDYQQQATKGNELHRPDNSIGGVPPELAVVSGLGLGRAVAGGSGMVGKAVAGAKEMVSQAEPILKYEASKAALMHMGLPAPIAIPIAMAISGYRGGKAATKAASADTAAAAEAVPAATPDAAQTPMAAPPVMSRNARIAAQLPRRPATVVADAPAVVPAEPAGPVASAPVAPAPPAAPVVPQSGPGSPATPPRVAMSPQRIQNELGLAARRAKVTLTEPQYQQATDLVSHGKTPMEAVTAIGTQPPPTPAPAAAVPTAPTKLKLNKSELNEYVRLTRGGMSHPDAVTLIEQQRQLLQTLGTPATEDVIRAVVDRNTTGRWNP